MKKLIVASAAVVAAAFLSGHAFANPGGAAKAIEAPSAAVKVTYACRCRYHHHHYRCVAYPVWVPVAPCGGWGYGCGGGGGIVGAIFGW